MGVMDDFFVERKFDFVPARETDDSYIDDDGTEVVCGTKVYGYSVIENSFKGISVQGTTITMGEWL